MSSPVREIRIGPEGRVAVKESSESDYQELWWTEAGGVRSLDISDEEVRTWNYTFEIRNEKYSG